MAVLRSSRPLSYSPFAPKSSYSLSKTDGNPTSRTREITKNWHKRTWNRPTGWGRFNTCAQRKFRAAFSPSLHFNGGPWVRRYSPFNAIPLAASTSTNNPKWTKSPRCQTASPTRRRKHGRATRVCSSRSQGPLSFSGRFVFCLSSPPFFYRLFNVCSVCSSSASLSATLSGN